MADRDGVSLEEAKVSENPHATFLVDVYYLHGTALSLLDVSATRENSFQRVCYAK